MTPLMGAILTCMVIGGGAFAIVYALRFFPITKPRSDQLEMDLDVAPAYLKRSRAAAHEARQATNVVRKETARLKAKPRIKR